MFKYLFGIVFLLGLFSCQSEYEKSHENWKAHRLAELKDPYGWPSVTGLFHLRNTYGYFGRGDENDFMIPNSPSSIGILNKTDTGIVMTTFQSIPVTVDGEVKRTAPLKSDRDPNGPTLASYKNLQWHIIERGENYYLRVKDTLSPYRQALSEIPTYPLDESFRVTARKVEFNGKVDTVSYRNILDMTITNPVAAYLSFEWQGEEYTLTALENDEETYFVMINDLTTGEETYGGGRYLYPDVVDSTGFTILDFNKLINPPCVFTPYATCPFPPEENTLPFAVRAGEMNLKLY